MVSCDNVAAGAGVREAGPHGPHAEEAPQGRPQGPDLLADDHAARHPRGLPPTPVNHTRPVCFSPYVCVL